MKWLGLLFFVMCFGVAQAQAPYARVGRSISYPAANVFSVIGKDSVELTDPQKATYFALIPGGGQIYNKKYVKAGIVYAGFASLIVFNRLSADSLSKYQAIYVNKIDDDPTTVDDYPDLSTTAAKNFRDGYRRNRDISILGFAGLYALQIIDANVDAHLKEFKINKELSLKVSPEINTYLFSSASYSGLSLKLTF